MFANFGKKDIDLFFVLFNFSNSFECVKKKNYNVQLFLNINVSNADYKSRSKALQSLCSLLKIIPTINKDYSIYLIIFNMHTNVPIFCSKIHMQAIKYMFNANIH